MKSVVDRRIDTFSTESVFVLDLTDHYPVTHLWLKGTGIDSIVAVDASNANLVNLTDTSTRGKRDIFARVRSVFYLSDWISQ